MVSQANCTAPATDALLCTIATPSTPTLGAVGDSCSEDRGCESLWCSTARICADATTSSGSVAVGDHCLTDVACLQVSSALAVSPKALLTPPLDSCSPQMVQIRPAPAPQAYVEAQRSRTRSAHHADVLLSRQSDCSAPATDPLICSTSTPSPTSNTTLLDNGSPCDNDASCTDKFCAASRICTSPTDASLQGAIQDAEHCPAGFNATCIVPQSVQADPPVSAACLCPSSVRHPRSSNTCEIARALIRDRAGRLLILYRPLCVHHRRWFHSAQRDYWWTRLRVRRRRPEQLPRFGPARRRSIPLLWT